MGFNGFHHIGLCVADAERSLAFYKAIGGEVTFSFPMGETGKTIYLVDLGGHAVVELIPSGTGAAEAAPKWLHIAVETGDARAAHEMALAAGAKERSAPQDAMLGTMAVCNSFVLGPDDEVIEFFEVKG